MKHTERKELNMIWPTQLGQPTYMIKALKMKRGWFAFSMIVPLNEQRNGQTLNDNVSPASLEKLLLCYKAITRYFGSSSEPVVSQKNRGSAEKHGRRHMQGSVLLPPWVRRRL